MSFHGQLRTYAVISLLVFTGLLSACATAPDNTDVGSAKIKAMAAKDGAMTGRITDKLGNQKEFVILPSFDFQTEVTKIGSKDAKSCQHFASFSRPQKNWLKVCDAALADPTLSAQIAQATQFNRALIQLGLGDLEHADAAFKDLAERHPDFGDAVAERAKIARLRYDYPRSIALAQEAARRGLAKPYRAHLIMGKAYEGNFQFEDARAAYHRARELAPKRADIRKNLARLDRLWPANRHRRSGATP